MDQWPRVKEIFQSALDRAPEERSAFVREACGEDRDLRAEVESLLLAHQEAGGFARGGIRDRADSGLDLIGREIGAYRILSLLGAGGHGGGLSRARHQTRPRCRHQGFAVRVHGDAERRRASSAKRACWPR